MELLGRDVEQQSGLLVALHLATAHAITVGRLYIRAVGLEGAARTPATRHALGTFERFTERAGKWSFSRPSCVGHESRRDPRRADSVAVYVAALAASCESVWATRPAGDRAGSIG